MTKRADERIRELVFEAFEEYPNWSTAWSKLVKLVGATEAQRLLEAEGPRRVRMLDLDVWKE